MKLAALDIPDNPADWPAWLEGQLVGIDLAELVVELETLVPNGELAPSLEDVCGEQMDDVLETGLGVLSDDQLRSLLKHPRLLFPLQERVLIDGGEYWGEKDVSDEHRNQADRHWQAISAQLHAGTPVATAERHAAPPRRRALAILGTVAAAVVVGLGVWMSRPAAPTWGFDKRGLLTADVPAPLYLSSLADAADDWFNKRPEDTDALAQRLEEFRHGCETLVAAPHPQLAPEDRQWLVDKCKLWKGKIEGHLADLRAGVESAGDVRKEADETVRTLIDALKKRAASLG